MHGWTDCPGAVRDQVEGFAAALEGLLGGNLRGLYLHGSLAMGCFNPGRSDIDLLVATRRPLESDARRRLVETLLRFSRTPRPLEVSSLTDDDRRTWRHPLPFDFHFSEEWRERFTRALSDGGWRSWSHFDRGDRDLAAHLTVLSARGLVLRGEPVAAVFPVVPRKDYVDSVLYDSNRARRRKLMTENRVCLVLNLCRVYALLREGVVTSKEEGGRWALSALPGALRPVVEHALALYRGATGEERFEQADILRFDEELVRRIEKSTGIPEADWPSDAPTRDGS